MIYRQGRNAMPMPDADYEMLEKYVRHILESVGATGATGVQDAFGDLMHTLSAWDSNNQEEFKLSMERAFEKKDRTTPTG
jgi:hypothetical protein